MNIYQIILECTKSHVTMANSPLIDERYDQIACLSPLIGGPTGGGTNLESNLEAI